jgi:hypothetical protein
MQWRCQLPAESFAFHLATEHHAGASIRRATTIWIAPRKIKAAAVDGAVLDGSSLCFEAGNFVEFVK